MLFFLVKKECVFCEGINPSFWGFPCSILEEYWLIVARLLFQAHMNYTIALCNQYTLQLL